MEFGDMLLSIFLAVLQTIILIGFGVVLALFQVVTEESLKSITKLNYYCLLPAYSFLGVMNALKIEQATTFLMISFGNAFIYGVSFAITFIFVKIFHIDPRLRGTFILIGTIGNIFILPGLIIEFSCKAGGILDELGLSDACAKSNNGWSFSNCAIAWFNITLWIIAIPLINMDKKVSIEVKTILKDVLQIFPNLNAFIENTDFNEAIALKKQNNKDKQSLSEQIEKEYFQLRCTPALLSTLREKHKQFLQKALSLNIGFEKAVYEQNKIGFNFVLLQLIEPPTLLSLLGLIGALIQPMRTFIFDDKSKFAMFLATFNKVASMAIPISMFILGSKLFLSYSKFKNLLVKKKEIIIMCSIKQFIIPALGLGILWILSAMSSDVRDSKIVEYLLFLESAVPSALTLITAFVVGGHGSGECALLLFWQYIICILPLTVAIFVWSLLYMR